MVATSEIKQQVAKKVYQSMLETMEEEVEHYMFLTGIYDETDNNYWQDRKDVIKMVAELLVK